MPTVEYPKGSTTDGKLFHFSEREQTSGRYAWTMASSLGGSVNATHTSVPIFNSDGRLEVFYRGEDRKLYHCWQHRPDGPWTEPSSLGQDGFTFRDSPAVGRNLDGHISVFVHGYDNRLYRLDQVETNGGWGSFGDAGGPISSAPVVVTHSDGRLEVFALGPDNDLVHTWQSSPNGDWGGWDSRGGDFVGIPSVLENDSKRLEVFLAGSDGSVQHIRQTEPTKWSGWQNLGTPNKDSKPSSPSSVKNLKTGQLEVFVQDGDQMYGLEQRSDGKWHSSDWKKFDGDISTPPIAMARTDGSIDVYALSGDQYLETHYQVSSKSIQRITKSKQGDWDSWTVIGGRASIAPAEASFAIARHPGDRLTFFATQGETHMPGERIRDSYNGHEWRSENKPSFDFDFLGVWKFSVKEFDHSFTTGPGFMTDHSWDSDATVSLRIYPEQPRTFSLYQVDGHKVALQIAEGNHAGALWTTRAEDNWLGLTFDSETHNGKKQLMFRATDQEAFSLENKEAGHVSFKKSTHPEYLISTLTKMTDGDSITGQPGVIRYDNPNKDSTVIFESHGSHLPILILSGSAVKLDLTYEDFTGFNVRNVDFTHATLKGANFSRATELRGTKFNGANLQKAIFDWQSLNDTDMEFSSADFSGADLRNIKPSPNSKLNRSNFTNANLSGIDLSGSDLAGANFTGSNLDEANLAGANLSGAIFTDASLNKTNLSGANLDKATLEDVAMNDTDVQGASFQGTLFINTVLTKAKWDVVPNFTRSTENRTTFVQCTIPFSILGKNWSFLDLTGAKEIQDIPLEIENLNAEQTIFPDTIDLRKRILQNANLKDSVINNADLDGADLTKANLTSAYLKGSKFSNAILSQANLTDAWLISKEKKGNLDIGNLEAANFFKAVMPNVLLDGAQCDGVNFGSAYLYSSTEISAQPGSATKASFVFAKFSNAKLMGMNFEQSDFRGAAMSNAILINANLERADLGPSTEATRSATTLDEADLRGCNMKSSNMDGTSLNSAKVSAPPKPGGFPQVYRFNYPKGRDGSELSGKVPYGATILGETNENTTCPNGDQGPCEIPDS